jgi:hypothetical protein
VRILPAAPPRRKQPDKQRDANIPCTTLVMASSRGSDLANAMQSILGPAPPHAGAEMRDIIIKAVYAAHRYRGFVGAPLSLLGSSNGGESFATELTLKGMVNPFSLTVGCRRDSLLVTLKEKVPHPSPKDFKGVIGLSCTRYRPGEAAAGRWEALVDLDGLSRLDALVEESLVEPVLAKAVRGAPPASGRSTTALAAAAVVVGVAAIVAVIAAARRRS